MPSMHDKWGGSKYMIGTVEVFYCAGYVCASHMECVLGSNYVIHTSVGISIYASLTDFTQLEHI